MTNNEFQKTYSDLVQKERRVTNEILSLICMAEDRRLPLELGFPSTYEWLIAHGYSHPAAYRRLQAARVLRAVPQASAQLQSGELSLTTLSKVQTILKAHEKISKTKISAEEKKEILDKVAYKSVIQTEQTLLSMFPDAASKIVKNQIRVIDENTQRLSLNFSNDQLKDLQRAKEVLSHIIRDGETSSVVAYSVRFLLSKKDPLRKSAADMRRVKSLPKKLKVPIHHRFTAVGARVLNPALTKNSQVRT